MLSTGIPALNDTVERLADDGIVRGFDDGCEQTRRQKLLCLVLLQTALHRNVSEDQHASGNLTSFVGDRGGAVIDRTLAPVLLNQHSVVREADDDSFTKGFGCRIFNRPTSLLVDDSKNRIQRLTEGIPQCPAGQRLGNGIQIGDVALHVGGDDGVANAAKRYLQQFVPVVCPSPGSAHGFAKSDDQCTCAKIRNQPDDICDVVQAKTASRWNEQIRTRHVAEDRHDHGQTIPAHPRCSGNSPEQRDERQRVTHQGIERPAEQDGRHNGGDG